MRSIIFLVLLAPCIAAAETVIIDMTVNGGPEMARLIVTGDVVRYCIDDIQCPGYASLVIDNAILEHTSTDTIMRGSFGELRWQMLFQPPTGAWHVLSRTCSVAPTPDGLMYVCD